MFSKVVCSYVKNEYGVELIFTLHKHRANIELSNKFTFENNMAKLGIRIKGFLYYIVLDVKKIILFKYTQFKLMLIFYM